MTTDSPTRPALSTEDFSSSSFDICEPFGWILTTQCLVALILNLTVLTTFCKDRGLRSNGSAALLLNLIAADLGITLCGCPFSAFAAFARHWPFGELGCTLYGFQVISPLTELTGRPRAICGQRYPLPCFA